MLFLENVGECVFCIGDKNIIPGTDPVEVTKEEAEYPTVKLYIKAKKLSLSEVEDKEVEPAAKAEAEAEKAAADNQKPKK